MITTTMQPCKLYRRLTGADDYGMDKGYDDKVTASFNMAVYYYDYSLHTDDPLYKNCKYIGVTEYKKLQVDDKIKTADKREFRVVFPNNQPPKAFVALEAL